MDDHEIAACVAEVVGCKPDGSVIEPLGGRQGLIVARVTLGSRRFVFKAIRESLRKELCLARFVGGLGGGPAVLGGEEDARRGLFWIVMEDLGETRLADSPNVEGYCRSAQALARMQIRCLEQAVELADLGLRIVDVADWETIALNALELADEGDVHGIELDPIVFSASELARDAATIPGTLVHSDLHAGNIVLVEDGALLLDWGSAYIAAAFTGLEELLWPAAPWLNPCNSDRVKAAYLREWAPLLGKPGPLEKAVLACRTLVRLQIMQSTLESGDQFAARAVYRRLRESWEGWRRA